MQKQVNINSAPVEELVALPGVGPAMAERIIDARPFEMIDDLRLISGVGPALLERWTPLITLADPASPDNIILLSAESSTKPETGAEQPSPEDDPIPSWDGSQPEAESEFNEPGIPMPREKSIVPFQSQDPEEQEKADVAKPITRNQAIGLIAVSSLAAFILAVLLTLGILSTINGGLRFGSADQVSGLAAQSETLNLQIQTLNQEIASLRARLDNIEGLSSRVNDLESQMEALKAEVASTTAMVEEINGQIDEILENTTIFQSFLDGLTDLLVNLRQDQGAP